MGVTSSRGCISLCNLKLQTLTQKFEFEETTLLFHSELNDPEPLTKELLPLDMNGWKSWRVRYKIERVLQLHKETSKAVGMISA